MKKIFLASSSVIASLVAASPILTCPACWPLYAGMLSAMGISFINYTQYILPVTIIMLLISLGSMGWKAQSRHGFFPLIIGGIGGGILLVGKFYIDNDYVFYSGAALLVIASIWNIWPKKKCQSCR